MNLKITPPRRIPQLYFGPVQQPWQPNSAEKIADHLFLDLVILSWILALIGGILGYVFYQWYGLAIFAMLGYTTGAWMRRSMGLRGRKATTGFFRRMRERANGSRPQLLESLLERISGHPLTQSNCKAIVQIYDRAVKQLKQVQTIEERNRILADLDRRIKQIVYR